MPIVHIKVSVPPLRREVIFRERLLAELDNGLGHRLILVSAPAGFGKTSLIRSWVEERGIATAWLSLETADSAPPRFLAYVIAAMQTVAPGFGADIVPALSLSPSTPSEAILTAVANELTRLDQPIVLVLDDYHLVNVDVVNDVVTFLIAHLQPHVHLVITTREDPQLPLPRLRARGEMTELRASDLRFTVEEATLFLRNVMGIELPAAEIDILENRTEGWIAGLQLAALSMKGRDDISGFISAFAGDNRYIADYLVDEVLRRQPEDVRQFLLESSILERMNGEICDAVTGRDDSSNVLEALERSNLFVTPLDDNRQWYRYHHLFAQALQAHAAAAVPDAVQDRHRRASEWFERHHMLDDAVKHAFAAQDIERAALLVEKVSLRMLGSSEAATLWSWMERIPAELMGRMPVLCTYYAFESLNRVGLETAEHRFSQAERWLRNDEDLPAGAMIVTSDARFRALPGTIAVGRAYIAGGYGDVDGIIQYGRHALAVMPADDDLWTGAAAAVLGIGLWTSGDLDDAFLNFERGRDRLDRAGYSQFQNVSIHILADIRIAQGRLADAERMYRESLRLATRDESPQWGTVDILVGLAQILLERNEIESAIQHLVRSKELGDHAGLLDTRHRWFVAMASVKQAEGDWDGALAMLDEAARLYIPGADPDLRPIGALMANVWIAQGRIHQAANWAQGQSRDIDDSLLYLREFALLTVARVLIAQARQQSDPRAIHDAQVLLGRLRVAAERGARRDSVIRILVMQTLASEANDDIQTAVEYLEIALSLAESEGYVRTFISEGNPMLRLLSEVQARGNSAAYAGMLLESMRAGNTTTLKAKPAAAYLLSQRELEVLQLIAQGLSNKEISERLYLALDTVKGHNRRIFGKLDVQRRTEAIARARAMGLLEV